MSKLAWEKAVREVENRRLQTRITQEGRIEEVNRKIPQIVEINYQLAQTSEKILDLVFGTPDYKQAMAELAEQNMQAQCLSRQLLVEYGYPEDYLDVHYTCQHCDDTGIHDNRRCHCVEELATFYAIEEMNKHVGLELVSFSDFSFDYYAHDSRVLERMTQIYKTAKRFAESLTPESKGLLFYGRTGLGKTHLSLAIVNEVLQKGYDVIYDSTIEILHRIEDEHFGRAEGNTMELLRSADLLVLDDLGTEFQTGFNRTAIYDIINSRHKPTIINTNLDLHGIRQLYEDRIVSRITNKYEVWEFLGEDIRLLKKQAEIM